VLPIACTIHDFLTPVLFFLYIYYACVWPCRIGFTVCPITCTNVHAYTHMCSHSRSCPWRPSTPTCTLGHEYVFIYTCVYIPHAHRYTHTHTHVLTPEILSMASFHSDIHSCSSD
jgi:hypothetical protein